MGSRPTTNSADRPEVCVCSELDIATGPALLAAVRRFADQPPAVPVTVDLGEVTFMDGTGLEALIAAHRAVDGALVLQDPAPQVQRLLDITRVRIFRLATGP